MEDGLTRPDQSPSLRRKGLVFLAICTGRKPGRSPGPCCSAFCRASRCHRWTVLWFRPRSVQNSRRLFPLVPSSARRARRSPSVYRFMLVSSATELTTPPYLVQMRSWQRDAREQNKERRPTVERNAPRKGPGFLPVEVAREHSPLRPGEGPLRSLWEPGIKEGRTFPRLIIQGGTGWVLEWQGPVEPGALEAALRAVVGICGLR